MTEILRLAAFTDIPEGGNPAGVVLDATALDDATMQAIAADVGYSETAFLTGVGADRTYDVRYFSPAAEVPFCGHATIATAVALAQRDGAGDLVLTTKAGPVAVRTQADGEDITATLTSVAPHLAPPPSDDELAPALAALRWSAADLDPALPPRIAYAGARHLILAARTRERLADLDYDFDCAQALHVGARSGHGRPRLPRRRRRPSTRATPSRSAASSRTRRPVPRQPRSAPTSARWSW